MPIAWNTLFARPAELVHEGREGTPFNASGERTYTAQFQVEALRPDVVEIAVCACPGNPLPYSPHPSDLAALCVSLKARLKVKTDWKWWIVTATWSTKMPDGGPVTDGTSADRPDEQQARQNNPEMEPPDIEWDFETASRAPAADLDLNPFVNSAKQPYTPAVTFEYADAVLSITRNENDYNRATAAAYSFAVNKFKFLDAAPGCVQCLPPKAKLQYKGSISYYRVSYRLRFGEMLDDGTLRPWDPAQILDAGLMQLALVPGSKDKWAITPILGPGGQAISQPVCLDGKGRQSKPIRIKNGGPLKPDGTRDDIWIVKQAYNSYRLRRKLDFANLLRNGLGRQLQL